MPTFKWICTELELEDHDEEIFTVVEEQVSVETFLDNPESDAVICDTYSEENADLIVRLLNEHYAKEAAPCTTRIH